MQQGNITTLVLWIVSIAVRLALAGVGHVTSLAPADSMAELPLLLAITLGTQNLVIAARSTAPTRGLPRAL